jgi:hypothetical protein
MLVLVPRAEMAVFAAFEARGQRLEARKKDMLDSPDQEPPTPNLYFP